MKKLNINTKTLISDIKKFIESKIEKIFPIMLMINTLIFASFMNYITIILFLPIILYFLYLLFKSDRKSYNFCLRMGLVSSIIILPIMLYLGLMCSGQGVCALFEIIVIVITYMIPISTIIIISILTIFIKNLLKKRKKME